jgi:hypothetical protein
VVDALFEALLELFDHGVKIGITGAKAPRQPISAAFDDGLPVGNYIELAGFARRDHSLNTEPLLDEFRETRGLGLIARSSWAGTYFNSHWCVLK